MLLGKISANLASFFSVWAENIIKFFVFLKTVKVIYSTRKE